MTQQTARAAQRGAPWGVALLCALLCACGDDRFIGSSCATAECRGEALSLPPPIGCGAQFAIEGVQVSPEDEELDHCELFTLDALDPVGEHGHVYLTFAQVAMSPINQHVDVRIAQDADEFPDGPVKCSELWGRALTFIPLMTARGAGGTADFGAAPLAAAPADRLLINHHVLNGARMQLRVDLRLNLSCATAQPAIVSQAFEFSKRQKLHVVAGDRKAISASCTFEKAVRVSRLYRRTHLITAFTVRLSQQAEVLWSSRNDENWTFEPAHPLEFEAGGGFDWVCEYDNMSDRDFVVGGPSSDACSLLGLYQLPDGGEDRSAQSCLRLAP